MVRRSDQYVLFTSSGNFQTCRYRTVWRRSTDLTDFSTAKSHAFLTRSRTGVCGPGGADLARRGGATLMFFHGWMCGSTPPYAHCPSHFGLDEDGALRPRRSMFAARLKWTGNDRPRLRFFVAARGQSVRRSRSCGSSHTCGSGPAGTTSVGLMSSWTT